MSKAEIQATIAQLEKQAAEQAPYHDARRVEQLNQFKGLLHHLETNGLTETEW